MLRCFGILPPVWRLQQAFVDRWGQGGGWNDIICYLSVLFMTACTYLIVLRQKFVKDLGLMWGKSITNFCRSTFIMARRIQPPGTFTTCALPNRLLCPGTHKSVRTYEKKHRCFWYEYNTRSIVFISRIVDSVHCPRFLTIDARNETFRAEMNFPTSLFSHGVCPTKYKSTEYVTAPAERSIDSCTPLVQVSQAPGEIGRFN
jgi:hypothetical protein